MQYGQRIKHPPRPKGYTSVWIEETSDDQVEMYLCHKCGSCVFQHGGHVASTIPDYHKSKLPLVVMCPNRNCRRKYAIQIPLPERL